MGKLVDGYIECCLYIPDTPCSRGGRFHIILTPDGHVWLREGVEEKHPECFIPEPKKGAFVRVLLFQPTAHKEFLCVVDPDYSSHYILVVDGRGKEWVVSRNNVELISVPENR